MAADEIGDDGKIEEGSLALLGMTESGVEERATRRKLAGMGSSSVGPHEEKRARVGRSAGVAVSAG